MPVEEKKSPAVQRAQELFTEYYASCFWHMKRDLVITEVMIPSIVKGLRAHGGRSAFLAAAELLEKSGK